MTPSEALTKLETLLTSIAPVIVGMDIENYPINGTVPVIFMRPASISESSRDDQAAVYEMPISIEYITSDKEPTGTMLSAWSEITAAISIRVKSLRVGQPSAQFNYRVVGGTFSTVSINVTLRFADNFSDSSEVY